MLDEKLRLLLETDEDRCLMTLRDSKLKDGEVRLEFYQVVIAAWT